MIHGVIMAGGAGTRFWPASRKQNPKQLLKLLGERSMLQATVDRLGSLGGPEQVMIVTNEILVESIRQQLPDVPAESIVGEPAKRDTAPCVGLAAALVAAKDPEGIMVVMPADHVIEPAEKFTAAIEHAVALVENDEERIVTFGIKPTYPAEVFGYIERSANPVGGSIPTFSVQRFREKPDARTANEFLESGMFYWNAGIFVWKAKTILAALEKFEPEMHSHIAKIGAAVGTGDYLQVLRDEFTAIQGTSIDYAVMERYDNVLVVEAPYDWDDLGNWTALPRLSGVDEDGNTIAAKHLGINTNGTVVRSDDDHLIVTVGMEDCIVVRTPDATLIARKDQESAVKEVVKKLEENGWHEYL
jgi:mannose-1-phosphate guanylyltransferase